MTATKLEIEANNQSHSTEITYFTVPSRFQDERCQNRVCFAHYIAY